MDAMSAVHDRVRTENAAWWAAHPELHDRRPYAHGAKDLVLSVVHWHHNVEGSTRHKTELCENDRYWLRQYAILATQVWLAETQQKLDAQLEGDLDVDWYVRRDLESLVRNLQIALDDFEWNDRHCGDPKDPTREEILGGAALYRMTVARDELADLAQQLNDDAGAFSPSPGVSRRIAALRAVGGAP